MPWLWKAMDPSENGCGNSEGSLAKWSPSSSAFPSYISGVHHFGCYFCVCDCFLIQPLIEVVTSVSRMVHAGCVFVACIHPSRAWMSGSFESVWWNVCVHRLDIGLYSHPKEFSGNGVRTHVNSKVKIPPTRKILLRGGWNPQPCIKQDSEPNTLPMSYSSPQTKPWSDTVDANRPAR